MEAELTQTLPDLGPTSEAARVYARALVLGRAQGRPVALTECDLPIESPALGAALRAAAEPALADALSAAPEPDAAAGELPLVSLILPTRDRVEGARRLIESALAAEWPRDRLEVVLVDSASSTDGVVRLGRELADAGEPVVTVRVGRPGASAARNRGLENARGSIVAFTDDDVVLDTGWFRGLVASFADPTVDVVSGLVLPLELETPAQHWFEQYGGFSSGRGLAPRRYDLGANRPDNVLFPWGTAELGSSNSLAYRTEVLRALGGFDEALGAGTFVRGGEDTELLRRTVVAGHTVAFAPEALAWHQHRRDVAGLRQQLYGYGRGLTASILQSVLHDPASLVDLLRRVPRAVRYALLPSGEKNARKAEYPFSLTALELVGMATGPFALVVSRQRLKRALLQEGFA